MNKSQDFLTDMDKELKLPPKLDMMKKTVEAKPDTSLINKQKVLQNAIQEKKKNVSAYDLSANAPRLEKRAAFAIHQGEVELDLSEIDKILSLKDDAKKLFKNGKYLEALRRFEQAIQLLPGDIDLIYYEALCLMHLGNLKKSEQIFEELIKIDVSRSLVNLPKVYTITLLKQSKFSMAEKYLKVFLETQRYDTQAMNMLAYALERQDKLEEAEKMTEKILKDEPSNPNACNSMAYIYLRRNKNLNDALRYAKQALLSEPQNPAYLDTLGMILQKKGNSDSARKALQKALNLDPKNAEILSHLTDLLKI